MKIGKYFLDGDLPSEKMGGKEHMFPMNFLELCFLCEIF